MIKEAKYGRWFKNPPTAAKKPVNTGRKQNSVAREAMLRPRL